MSRNSLRYRILDNDGEFEAEVIGPFHSRHYGTTAYATTEKKAFERMILNLVSDGWSGTFDNLHRGNVDEVDTIGRKGVAKADYRGPVIKRR